MAIRKLFAVADTRIVSTEEWPPEPGEYVPRRILERLESLRDITQVRSSAWTDDTAEVAVWPFSDEIVAAVTERLAPLKVKVEAQAWLPRRLSGAGG